MVLEDLVLLPQLAHEPAVDGLEPAIRDAALHDLLHVVEIEGLGDVVVGSFAQRVDRRGSGGVAGHDDDCHLRVFALGKAHDLEAGETGQIDVGEHQVGLDLGDEPDRFLTAQGHRQRVAFA